jgi:hypothetical protein
MVYQRRSPDNPQGLRLCFSSRLGQFFRPDGQKFHKLCFRESKYLERDHCYRSGPPSLGDRSAARAGNDRLGREAASPLSAST